MKYTCDKFTSNDSINEVINSKYNNNSCILNIMSSISMGSLIESLLI